MWGKAWLEIRWRLVLLLGLNAGLWVLLLDDAVPAGVWLRRLDGALPFVFAIDAVMLASAGITTRTSYRPSQTIDGSMLFTLSLPISRRRLVLIRSAVGWLAAVALIGVALTGLWLLAPSLQATLPGLRLVQYGVAVAAVASVAFGVSTVFAAVFDQLWQTYASIGLVAAVLFQVPAARLWRGPLGFQVGGSPSGPDAVPLAGALVLAAVLMVVAVKLVERRDF